MSRFKKVVTMVYNARDHWDFGRFGSWTCFLPQVRMWETSTVMGPLVSKMMRSSEYRTMDKVQKLNNPRMRFEKC
jgi:hypothetical protein